MDNTAAGQFDTAQNSDEDSEVSLSTLQPDEVEKIMRAYRSCRDAADNYYRSEVEPDIIRRIDIYRATKEIYKKKFPNLSKSNNWVSRDVKTTIDWMLPSLIEAFTSSDDPVDVVGVNAEDDERAKKLQQLITYFVTRKNNYFTFMYNLALDGLKTNFGCAKVYWKREEDRQPMEVMADAQMMQILMAGQQQGVIEITSAEPITPEGDLLKVSFDMVNVKCNIPILENMSPSELRFTHESKDLHNAKYVAQRKIVHGDYLKRKENEGVYENVDRAFKEGSTGSVKHTVLDTRQNEEIDTVSSRLSDGDDASKEFELYEAYLKVDYNNDGVYENVIVHAVGNVPLKIQDNAFEMPPFFIFSPEYDPYSVFSEDSYADTLEQLQDLKTALVRQIIIATAKNNIPQKLVNEGNVDVDALIDGEEWVPSKSDNPGNDIYLPPQIQISPYTMELIQYAQNEIESQSGSTKYNQGLDSNSLNKTATGISAIMGAADKKIKLIARILAETAWIPIMKFLILLCQKFCDDGQIIRLTNDQNTSIRRDELNIDYDLIVNVGQGAGTKEAQIQYLMILMQQLYPLLQQNGIVNEDSWFNITKELLEKMGIRSTEKYLVDPQSQEAQQAKAQAQQAQQQAQAKADALTQAQLQLKEEDIKAKKLAKLSAQFNDLPIDAKIQALQQLGIQTTPQAMAQKVIVDRTV